MRRIVASDCGCMTSMIMAPLALPRCRSHLSVTGQRRSLMSMSWVLYSWAINFNNAKSLSIAWINISLCTRDNSQATLLKKTSFFIYALQSSANIGIWTSESMGCKQPLLVPNTFLKFCIFDAKVREEAFQPNCTLKVNLGQPPDL